MTPLQELLREMRFMAGGVDQKLSVYAKNWADQLEYGLKQDLNMTGKEEIVRQHLTRKAQELDIPDYMITGLVEYLVKHRPVGSFLAAVLSNDLRQACDKADDFNRVRVWNYVNFLYNHAPMESWGSEEKYDLWIANGWVARESAGS